MATYPCTPARRRREWNYALKDRPKWVVDEWGMLNQDKEEPVENLITWVFDEGTFKPAAKIIDGEQFSIVTDYLGTPVEMYNSQGERTWAVEYDIYGKVRKLVEGDVNDCPFRYQGQYEDCETGLYYNRFRYYSAEEGVYLSQDPIGLIGGNALYAYITDSNFWLDPLGLAGMPKNGWNYGNMPKIEGYQNHHVIPRSKANHPAIKAAGFNVDKPSNLIYLPKEQGTHTIRS